MTLLVAALGCGNAKNGDAQPEVTQSAAGGESTTAVTVASSAANETSGSRGGAPSGSRGGAPSGSSGGGPNETSSSGGASATGGSSTESTSSGGGGSAGRTSSDGGSGGSSTAGGVTNGGGGVPSTVGVVVGTVTAGLVCPRDNYDFAACTVGNNCDYGSEHCTCVDGGLICSCCTDAPCPMDVVPVPNQTCDIDETCVYADCTCVAGMWSCSNG